MNRSRSIRCLVLTALLPVLGASSALAVRRTEDPLALVPAGAATVAVIHWSELRNSPLGPKVFSAMDELSTDGDAARFLEETELTPSEDIDTVIVAMTPGARSGDSDEGLVVFEGRFDVDRIARAMTARGATRLAGAGGDFYYRLANKGGGSDGAVALVNRTLILAGSEAAVEAALARKESGGAGGLTSGQGLGRNLKRVDMNASAWALVDLARLPSGHREDSEGSGEPSHALMGAMKSVTLLAVQASVHGDSVDLSATGLTNDAENRDLLEDSLRGMLAMWRLAVQEKSPELVSVLRRFQIDNDSEGVSIRGTLPGNFLRSLSNARQARR
jgi:hypothetical protein